MKTRKYFCFVCILIIFTVVFALTGCRDDAGENDEPPAMRGPEFRAWGIWGRERETGVVKDGRIFFESSSIWIMGTFDEPAWKGIDLRLHWAFDRLLGGHQQHFDPDTDIWTEEWVEPIISDDIHWETFSRLMSRDPKEDWHQMESSFKSAIVFESNVPKTDYEWYKVTGEKTLYEISGDEDYNYDAYWNIIENVLYINYNKINELLVPIDDGNGGQKPALAVAILALHKAVTTGVLSQK